MVDLKIPNEQSLCLLCGFCCDGTLFSHARIHPDESLKEGTRFEYIGGNNKAFRQPCPYYKPPVCTIYASRHFKVCESFKCKLLKQYENGEIKVEEALRLICEVRDLRNKIEQSILEFWSDIPVRAISKMVKEFEVHHMKTMTPFEFRKKFGNILLDHFILKKKIRSGFVCKHKKYIV